MSPLRSVRLAAPARRTLAPFVRLAREAPLHASLLYQTRQAPRLAFLPAYGPEGAALLRIYAMAGALRDLGWQCLVVPPKLTLPQRLRVLHHAAPDLILMQGVRHPLNRPVLYRDWPVFFDMDDADFHLPRFAAEVRLAMPEVAAVVAGSKYIADWCLTHGARETHVVWTGSPATSAPRPPAHDRPPVIAWAQTRPASYKREAALVAKLMHRLAGRHPGLTLRLYDRHRSDDPDFIRQFEAPGLRVAWNKTMGYTDYLASFDDVAIGLAPLCPEDPFIRGKSFGKVLAYIDRGVPVIGSDAGEHGRFFSRQTGVITNDVTRWAAAATYLLDHPEARQHMANRAMRQFRQHLTTEAAASRLSAIMMRYLGLSSGDLAQAS